MERTSCTSNHSKLVLIITLAAVVKHAAMSPGARSPKQRNNQASYWPYRQDRQRYRQTNDDRYQPDTDYYHYDDEGSCDIEVACRTETDEAIRPTSMKLPIRGPVGPPGQRGAPGEDGIPGLPGLPGQ